MRQPFSPLVAAAMAISCIAWSIAPVEAANVRMTPPAAVHSSEQSGVEFVGQRHSGDWSDNNWRNDNWRHNRRDRRRHHDNDFFSFNFGLGVPFAFALQNRYVPGRDCFENRDGRIYCRVN